MKTLFSLSTSLRSNKNTMSKLVSGFTLVEVVIVLTILIVLISIIVPSFRNVGGSQALDTTVTTIISVLNGAKSQAISSKEEAKYGVRILSNKIVSFEDSYGTENEEITISNLITLSTSTGIGNDIIFNKVSGNTNASGTITATIKNNPSSSSTIRIYSTGLIEKI